MLKSIINIVEITLLVKKFQIQKKSHMECYLIFFGIYWRIVSLISYPHFIILLAFKAKRNDLIILYINDFHFIIILGLSPKLLYSTEASVSGNHMFLI